MHAVSPLPKTRFQAIYERVQAADAGAVIPPAAAAKSPARRRAAPATATTAMIQSPAYQAGFKAGLAEFAAKIAIVTASPHYAGRATYALRLLATGATGLEIVNLLAKERAETPTPTEAKADRAQKVDRPWDKDRMLGHPALYAARQAGKVGDGREITHSEQLRSFVPILKKIPEVR